MEQTPSVQPESSQPASPNNKKNILFIAIAAVIVVSFLAIGFYTLGSNNNKSASQSVSPVPSSVERIDLTACSQKEQIHLRETELVVSGLVVLFPATTTLEQGKEILSAYPEMVIQNQYESLNGYLVSVPQGEEVKYKCLLQNDSQIESIDYNQQQSSM